VPFQTYRAMCIAVKTVVLCVFPVSGDPTASCRRLHQALDTKCPNSSVLFAPEAEPRGSTGCNKSLEPAAVRAPTVDRHATTRQTVKPRALMNVRQTDSVDRLRGPPSERAVPVDEIKREQLRGSREFNSDVAIGSWFEAFSVGQQ
jgi:hypothetical protein